MFAQTGHPFAPKVALKNSIPVVKNNTVNSVFPLHLTGYVSQEVAKSRWHLLNEGIIS